nr:MAG TPA: hypothetical protein [Bacteriophage sp.]DAU18057.1 MAG TPA: hypothetical protein [Bacteriophage sp.]
MTSRKIRLLFKGLLTILKRKQGLEPLLKIQLVIRYPYIKICFRIIKLEETSYLKTLIS